MSNGFFHVSVQIARDWTGFWGFDGYFRCLFDILGIMDGERKLRRRMATWRSLLLLATLQNVLLRVLNHFLDRKGVSGGAPVAQGHLKFKRLAYLELPPPYEGVLITCFCNTQFVLHMQMRHEHRCGYSEKKPSKKGFLQRK